MQRLTIVLTLFLIIAALGILWWKDSMSPVNSSNKEPIIFVVQKGIGLKEIANKLENEGLIKNRVAFFLYTRLGRFEKKIQAGSFRLYQSMTSEEIAQNLTHGTLDIWVTISEGKRAAEIAEILKEKIPTYDISWANALASNEGYLFPDTYLIPKDAGIKMIINQMRENFNVKYASLGTNNTNLTQEEIVILASLIEREAITDAEKPIIAGILLNRLNAAMPLQVDATIQYAKGNWKPVSIEEYKSVASNYNTYLFTGLPPGPISNPGIVALRAVAEPFDTDYLYYLHDKDRKIRYAKTLSEHNANIENFGL